MRRVAGLAWWLAVLVGLAGCFGGPVSEPGAQGEEEAEPTSGAAEGEDPSKEAPLLMPDGELPRDLPELEELARQGRLQDQELKVLSDHYFKTGLRLYDSYRYQEAKDSFQKAVALDEGNREARRYLSLTQFILDEEPGEYRGTIERLGDEHSAGVEEKRLEMETAFREAEEAMAADDYETAIDRYNRVLELIRWVPAQIDVGNYEDRAQEELAQAEQRLRETRIKNQEEREREALARVIEEEQRRKALEERRIGTLLEQVSDMLRLKKYGEAERLANRILEIDPSNQSALRLKEHAQKGRHLEDALDIHRANLENEELDRERMLELEVPNQDVITWPDRPYWERVNSRVVSFRQNRERSEPAWVQEIKKNLDKVSIPKLEFREVALSDVVGFLSSVGNVNIVLDGGDSGVDPTTKIKLDLTDIRLKDALEIIMEQTGYTYFFDNQALIITTEENAGAGDVEFVIYPVPSLMNKIVDFTGPRIAVPNPEEDSGGGGGGSGGVGGGGGLIFDDTEESTEKTIDPEALKSLVESVTGEDNWDFERTIEYYNGQLFVINTPEVHREIEELLNQLRKNTGLFVTIEARFIDITDDFLHEVGVDYRGLGRSTPGFGTPLNLDPNASGGLDAGGSQTFNPNMLSRYPNASNSNQIQNNLIYRMQNIFDGFAGPLIGTRLFGGGGLSLNYTVLEPFQLSAILRAEKQRSNIKLVNAPVVTAANRQRVYISVLTQRAYIADYELSSGGTGLVVVEVADPLIRTFQEGVVLDVRPTVSSNKKYITLDVKPTLATLVGGTISTIQVNLGTILMAATTVPIGVPEISMDEAFTSVTIPDGGTALLGGFRQIDEKQYTSSIPILDSIPILNLLFKREGTIRETRSLIILITAKIIDPREEEKKRFNTR